MSDDISSLKMLYLNELSKQNPEGLAKIYGELRDLVSDPTVEEEFKVSARDIMADIKKLQQNLS